MNTDTNIQLTLDHLVPVLTGLAEVTTNIAAGFASADGEVPAGDVDEVRVTPAEAAQRIRKASGQPWSPDEAALSSSLEFFRQMVTPQSRGGNWFGAEVVVAEEASVLDRFLGFTGRDPGWCAS